MYKRQIKGSAHQEIAGVSAEGYEGLADGQKHGFTIHGLNVENDTVLDTVRITVRDAQGNPVTGLEDISLDALAGVTVGADGAVYVPLLSEMGAYQMCIRDRNIALRGLESIAVSAATDANGAPIPGLEARTFTFESHGDITNGSGGEARLRFTDGSTPVTLREVGHSAQVLLADMDGGALCLSATADPGKLDYITTAEGLAQALGLASAEGDTVTLQGDVTLSKGLSLLLDANQTITLNLNGHTLRAEADMAYAAIALSGVGTLRLTGGALAGNAEALPLLFVAGGDVYKRQTQTRAAYSPRACSNRAMPSSASCALNLSLIHI